MWHNRAPKNSRQNFFHEICDSGLRRWGDFFDSPPVIRTSRLIAGCLLVWTAILSPAQAQSTIVTVTNFVTVTVTNFVTITNYVSPVVASAKIAATPKIVPPAKPHWDSTLTAGATLTRGNSDSLIATGKVLSDKKTPFNEYHLGADATYGSANGIANTELYHGFGQWNHLFSPKWYSFLRGEGLHDGIAQVKYRGTFTSGVGYYLVKSTNTTLSAEAGPGVVLERLDGARNNYATMRAAERFERKLNHGTARIWQNVEFLPRVDQPWVYLVNSEIGVESSLYKNVNLQVYLDDYFNSQPAPGLRRNDVKLVSGVTYKF